MRLLPSARNSAPLDADPARARQPEQPGERQRSERAGAALPAPELVAPLPPLRVAAATMGSVAVPQQGSTVRAAGRWHPWLYGGASLCLVGVLLTRWVTAEPSSHRAREESRGPETQLRVELDAAENARNWVLMEQLAQRLQQLPDAPAEVAERARDAQARAQDEQGNMIIYERFLQAVALHAHDAAVLRYGELSQHSVYRELGAVRYVEARKGFVKDHLERALGYARHHGCRDTQPHLDAVLAVAPDAAAELGVKELLHLCSPAAAAVARSEKGPRSEQPLLARAGAPSAPEAAPLSATVAETAEASAAEDPEEPAAPRAEAKSARSGAEGAADHNLAEAQRAYIGGDYQQAIRIARRNIDRDPERAWRVIGGAACYLGDATLVKESVNHLDEQAQLFVRHVCQRNGVTP